MSNLKGTNMDKRNTDPINYAVIQEWLCLINRAPSCNQFQKHNPKRENIWLFSELPTGGILRSHVTAREHSCQKKCIWFLQTIDKIWKENILQYSMGKTIVSLIFATISFKCYEDISEIDILPKSSHYSSGDMSISI